MNIIEPSWRFEEAMPDAVDIMLKLESMARIAYKSEGKTCEGSAEKLLRSVIQRGHESVLEHVSISVVIVCDRGVSHEIVRHRIGCSYTQESTRYCNYSDGKFGGLTFIKPCFWKEYQEKFQIWLRTMSIIEKTYFALTQLEATPQEARSVLPNSLKTEIGMTANIRAWRHFFDLRCATSAHPQMRQISLSMLKGFYIVLPVLFEDLWKKYFEDIP